MAVEDLRELIGVLEQNGELCRVAREVDPDLEIAAVTDRVCKTPGGGKALLFEKVRGHEAPVATNLFGSRRRTALALGVADVEELAGRLARDLGATPGGSADERLARIVQAPPFLPRWVPRPPCQEVVELRRPDLPALPALRSWPAETSRFLTLPLVFTRDPATGRTNCGMYRVEIVDGRTACIHWARGSDGGRHCRAYQARAKRMPVVVALGGDPALTYAAGAPLPAGIEEDAFAGYLRGRPVVMAKAVSCDLEVPASAEYVIEGYVDPGETRLGGVFGNHTGGYAPAEPRSVLRVTALTRRRDPIYPCTVVGPPPMEDVYFAKATERLFLPLLRADFPQIVDLNLPVETIFHRCALLSVRPDSGRDGRSLLRELWRSGFFQSARLLVLFDAGVDVQNPAEAFWRAVNRVDPARDLLVEEGRLGLDATAGEAGPRLAPDPETARRVAARWREYGIGI